MRKILRTQAPECLQQAATDMTEKYVTTVSDPNTKARFRWPYKCYVLIRQKLLEMTQGRCAFCDGPFTGSPKTVEHFRPKSKYPYLAYMFDNLFPCCIACQAAKKDRFDEKLLRPDDLEYQFEDYFMLNLREGKLEPSLMASPEHQQRAKTSIDYYNLNMPERNVARINMREYFNLKRNSTSEHIDINDFDYRYFLSD
ncbi:MAG: TIGR02646 family protein [Magnetococcus sp. DMHC-1]